MKITEKLLKPITEVKYLQTENAHRYRPILRYMYEQYEKIKYNMYIEDIFYELSKEEHFKDYTLEQCNLDLKALVEWGNLVAMQDISNVATIQEFKNRKYIYQLSEYSVEIERLVIRLENLSIEGASLEPSLFERLRLELEKINKVLLLSDKDLGLWWNDINGDFKRLNQNYQDYIKTFYGIKAEEFMKSSQFIVYKTELVQYLRDFIKELQNNSSKIEKILLGITAEEEEKLLEKVYNYERSIPRIEYIPTEEEIRSKNEGKWLNLKLWFIGTKNRTSEAIRSLEITDEIIRKITRYASQISESSGNALNRKEEYKKICELFCKCDTFEEANKLSSLVFGIARTKHIKSNLAKATDNINISIYEEVPDVVEIKPRVRNYQSKRIRIAIPDKSEEKRQLKAKYLKQIQEEREQISKITKNNRILISDISLVSNNIRRTLLKWIAKANATHDKIGRTDDGRQYKVVLLDKEKRCTIVSDDGALVIPNYEITFKD